MKEVPVPMTRSNFTMALEGTLRSKSVIIQNWLTGAESYGIKTSLLQGSEKLAPAIIPLCLKAVNTSHHRRMENTSRGLQNLIAARRVTSTGSTLSYVRYLEDFPAYPLTNIWTETQSGSGREKVYVVQTTTKVVERCLMMTTDPGDLVLDPTCGSGTTAYVAEQWGRHGSRSTRAASPLRWHAPA